jgi:hypothetical protein
MFLIHKEKHSKYNLYKFLSYFQTEIIIILFSLAVQPSMGYGLVHEVSWSHTIMRHSQ